ncbi:MAG: pilus assembly protein TadG-related protein [Chitinophagales bacterium]
MTGFIKYCIMGIYNHFARLTKEENGNAIILIALSLSALVGFAALVIDVGRMYYTYSAMRNAVDSAALAGAQRLPNASDAFQTAINYAVVNGLDQSEVQVTVPYQGSDDKIEVTCSRNIEFLLGPVIGQTSKTLTARAMAAKGGAGGIFDYAIFSGSQTQSLFMNGASVRVNGNAHTNHNAIVNGAEQIITGRLEASDRVVTNGSGISIGEIVPAAPYIPTPAWDMNSLKNQANVVYYGNQDFNGQDISVGQGTIFVDGDVTFNGCKLDGVGSIIATGKLIFNGESLTYKTASDKVCLYGGGGIVINGNGAKVDGIMYSPASSVTFNGSNQYVYGSVVANNIIFNGGGLEVKHDPLAIDALPVKTGSTLLE